MKKIIIFLITAISFLPLITYANFDTNLGYGNSGPAVSQLQQYLIFEGYLNTQATGYFGNLTEAALEQWQSSHGIVSTGFLGSISRAYLNTYASSSEAVGSTTSIVTINVPGCPPQARYNSMTGAPCASNTQPQAISTPTVSTPSPVSTVAMPTTPQPAPNTTQCNGTTYSLVCPSEEHFFCPTNGTTGECVYNNAQYCNGEAYSACPSGQNFSCTTAGGTCSPPTPPYQPTPFIPPWPTVSPAQQKALANQCQATYQNAVTDRQLELQQQIAAMENQAGASGAIGGQLFASEQQAQTIASSDVSVYESTLQLCLSEIPTVRQ